MEPDREPIPFEALLEGVEEGVFVLDADGHVVWENEAAREIAGGLSVGLGALIERVGLDALTDATRDDPVVAPLGAEANDAVEVHLRSLPDDRFAGWISGGAAADSTTGDLDRYRTVLDTVEDAIYMTDGERRLTWVNAATERMFGFDREALIGTHLFELLTDEQIEVARENLEYLLAEETPETITFEMDIETPDGGTVPVEACASLLPGEGFSGTVGVIRDVTERRRRRARLERQNERLEKFASIVSHDLRNPLQVAEGRLRLARLEDDPKHLAELETALGRMRSLIEDLTSLVMSEEPVIDAGELDVSDVVEASWTNVATGSATLVNEAESTVVADEGQVRRLVENLLDNAIEHGPADTVVVGDLADEPGFFVEDDGSGVPEHEREFVFGAGYSNAEDGTGYGLTIVEDVAEAHGWEVRLVEGADGGARFEVVADAGGGE